MNYWIVLLTIIAIFFFLATQYYRLKQESQIETIEHYENEINVLNAYKSLSPEDKINSIHHITIRFKNAKEASNLITPQCQYIRNMNQPNIIARGFASHNELYDSYINGFSDISKKECENVVNTILELLNKVKTRNVSYYKYLIYWLSRIHIAKSAKWLEDGMPHTLQDTIIMDAGWFIKPRINTLIHELTHIHQRRAFFEFEEIYKKLGYIYLDDSKNIKGFENILLLNRNNPDGIETNWLWNSKIANSSIDGLWWIGAVFYNINPNNLSDVNYIAVKINQGNDGELYYLKQEPRKLETFKEFNNFFGNNVNNYHPNEMTAKFAEWYLDDVLGIINKEKYHKYSGYLIYRENINKIFNMYYSNSN
jgi:hypothetical protein